jgi:hypothetical protein
MATWTSPITWTTGGVTSAQMNANIRDNETWLKGAFTQLNVTTDSAKAKITPALVGCRAYKAADQLIANATLQIIALDTERFDSDAFHDNVTNNTRFTIPASMGGYYMVGATALFAANATASRQVFIYVNSVATGTAIVGNTTLPGTSTAVYMSVSTLYQFAATDYVELVCYQNSGGNLNVTAVQATSPEMWIHRISST